MIITIVKDRIQSKFYVIANANVLGTIDCLYFIKKKGFVDLMLYKILHRGQNYPISAWYNSKREAIQAIKEFYKVKKIGDNMYDTISNVKN